MKHLTSLLALVILISLAAPQRASASQPSIWFCPLSQLTGRMLYTGSPEYEKLFAPNSPWTNAAMRVSVFKIYRDWIADATDAQLRSQFADLNRRHIALALEYGVLTEPPGCGGGEGFGGATLLPMVRRIHALGGDLKYVGMDEPLSHSVYKGNGACHVPLAQTIASAAFNLKAMLAEFPNVEIGDVEPIMDVSGQGMTQVDEIAGYQAGIEAFKAALGRPLAFFDADVDWNSRTTAGDLVALKRMLATETVPFGIIYDGNNGDLSDKSWLNSARHHMALAEQTVGAPDIVLFQSWDPYPRKLLPESDRDAFTSIIDSYFGARTKLTASLGAGEIGGDLKTSQGKPVATAPIDVSIHYRSPAGFPGVFTARGQIARGAVAAVFEIVNHQSVPRPSNIRVAGLKFIPDSGQPVSLRFTTPGEVSAWTGDGMDRVTFDNRAMRIDANPKVKLAIRSASFPVASDGQYTLQVSATVPFASEASGSFAVKFLDAHQHVISQYPFLEPVIPFLSPDLPVGRAMTTRNGSWSLKLPPPPAPDATPFLVTVDYAGDARNWPASARILCRF